MTTPSTPGEGNRFARNTTTTISSTNVFPEGDEVDPRIRMHEQGLTDHAAFGRVLAGTYAETWKQIGMKYGSAVSAVNRAEVALAELADPTAPQPQDPHLAARAIVEQAENVLDDADRFADAAMTKMVEAARKEALPPAPGGTAEQLAREQITTYLGEPSNSLEAVELMTELTASQNPAVVATLVGEFGRALARRYGIADADFQRRVVEPAIGAAAAGRLGAKYQRPATIVASWEKAAAARAGVVGGLRGRIRGFKSATRGSRGF